MYPSTALKRVINNHQMKFELYKKMLRGECSPQEIEQVMQWLQEDPGAFDTAMLQEAGGIQPKAIPPGIRQQILDYFEAKGIPAPVEAPVIQMETTTSRNRNWRRWSVAAAIFVIAIAGWLLYPAGKKKEHILAWKEIRNSGREVKTILLPDSSMVWLNAFATLRYKEDFNEQAQREVQLSGEAFFKVTHNEKRPFIVQTENLLTKVLGTEFNIEAYPEEQLIKVTLERGSVQVSKLESAREPERMQRILVPGQTATYFKSTSALTVKRSLSGTPAAWTRDGLVLNDVPLGDALNRIGRRYNQPVLFDSAGVSKYQHITAYYRDMDIEQILAQLGFTCNFRIKKIKNSYRIILR